MTTGKLLVAGISVIVASLAFQAQAAAWQAAPNATSDSSSTKMRERVTNQALLAAFIARRSEIAQMPIDPAKPEYRRFALAFLDRQIEMARMRLGE